jgi:D-3-phosphoglycerate dehydrogenase
MSRPTVLLIGGITHVQKEWQECSSFAELKVSLAGLVLEGMG